MASKPQPLKLTVSTDRIVASSCPWTRGLMGPMGGIVSRIPGAAKEGLLKPRHSSGFFTIVPATVPCMFHSSSHQSHAIIRGTIELIMWERRPLGQPGRAIMNSATSSPRVMTKTGHELACLGHPSLGPKGGQGGEKAVETGR